MSNLDTHRATILNEIRESMSYAFECISSYASNENLSDDDVLAILADAEFDVAERYDTFCE